MQHELRQLERCWAFISIAHFKRSQLPLKLQAIETLQDILSSSVDSLNILPTGPVSVRCHPPPEAPGNSIGLEAIIRKALMGNYDDQSDERSPSNPANPISSSMSAGPMADGRAEEFFSQGSLWSFPLSSEIGTLSSSC